MSLSSAMVFYAVLIYFFGWIVYSSLNLSPPYAQQLLLMYFFRIHASLPYITTGQIIVLYTLILRVMSTSTYIFVYILLNLHNHIPFSIFFFFNVNLFHNLPNVYIYLSRLKLNFIYTLNAYVCYNLSYVYNKPS